MTKSDADELFLKPMQALYAKPYGLTKDEAVERLRVYVDELSGEKREVLSRAWGWIKANHTGKGWPDWPLIRQGLAKARTPSQATGRSIERDFDVQAHLWKLNETAREALWTHVDQGLCNQARIAKEEGWARYWVGLCHHMAYDRARRNLPLLDPPVEAPDDYFNAARREQKRQAAGAKYQAENPRV